MAAKLVRKARPVIPEAWINPHKWMLQSPRAVEQPLGLSMYTKVRDGLLASVASDEPNLLNKWAERYIEFEDAKPPCRFHLELSKRLQNFHLTKGSKLCILAPRGYAKSTWITFLYVLEAALSGKYKYILIIADDHESAKTLIQALRSECENNLDLREAYPFLIRQERKDSHHEWSKHRLHLGNGTLIEARGTGKLRGRKHGQVRPDLVVVDDPANDEHKTSETKRTRLSKWFKSTLLKIGTKSTNFILAGTAIHRETLVMEVAKMKGWECIKYKAIEKFPENTNLWNEWEDILLNPDKADSEHAAQAFYAKHKAQMDKGSDVLWPESEPLYYLMMMRATEGKYHFEAEKQNNPVDPTMCEWPSELFEDDRIFFEEWPTGMECFVSALDPSKGKKDKLGDYQATAYLGYKDGFWYVDMDMLRQSIDDMMSTFLENARILRPEVAVIETEQFQEMVLTEVQARAKKMKITCPFEPISTYGIPKVVRIRRLGPYLNRKRIKFMRGSPGVRLLIEQLVDFPNAGHDDGPDVLEMAMRTARALIDGRTGSRTLVGAGRGMFA